MRSIKRCSVFAFPTLLVLQASVAWGQASSVIKAAPPLPPPTGTVVYVSAEWELEYQLVTASAGTTIMLNPGNYYSTKTLAPNAGLTIRGATGNRDDVVVWGGGMNNSAVQRNVFWITKSDITIADLTIRDAYYHGVQIAAEYQTDRIHLYNVKIIDCGERFIKGSTNNNASYRPDDCVIEYCWLEQVTPLSNHNDNDYIGGIDAMWCNRWIIRDNVMKNIRGNTGGGRGGIFLWNNCLDITVERNLVIGCDRGICIGNPSPPGVGTYHCTNGIVRNNFVVRGADIAMELCLTNNLKVYNNTVYSSDASYFRTLHVNGSVTTGLKVWENIIRGQALYSSGGTADTTGSIIGSSPLASWFVDPTNGDLRLTASATPAINTAAVLAEVTDDYFAAPRGSQPDKGAYEIPAAPPHVTGFSPPLGHVSYLAAPLTTMTITFDKDVTISAANVTVTGLNTGAHNNFTFSYNGTTRTATLSWAAGLPNDTYNVTVSDAVTAGGVALDGEMNASAPTLPSGNGTAGGAFIVYVYRLVGDIDEDKGVDAADLLLLANSWGKSTGQPGYDSRCDLNGNGAVDVSDLLLLAASWGTSIPAGS